MNNLDSTTDNSAKKNLIYSTGKGFKALLNKKETGVFFDLHRAYCYYNYI